VRVDDIIARLTSHRYSASTEAELQSAIAKVLDGIGYHVKREHVLSPRDRIDFYTVLPDGTRVGIEVKIKGSAPRLALQIHRYAESVTIDAIILATTSVRLMSIPREMAGKPVYPVRLPSGLF
jgi:predicted nucleic acid-binding protein